MNTLDEKLEALAREADSAIRVQEGTPGNLIVTLDRPEMVAILRRAIREAVLASGAIEALESCDEHQTRDGETLYHYNDGKVYKALAALRALTGIDRPEGTDTP